MVLCGEKQVRSSGRSCFRANGFCFLHQPLVRPRNSSPSFGLLRRLSMIPAVGGRSGTAGYERLQSVTDRFRDARANELSSRRGSKGIPTQAVAGSDIKNLALGKIRKSCSGVDSESWQNQSYASSLPMFKVGGRRLLVPSDCLW